MVCLSISMTRFKLTRNVLFSFFTPPSFDLTSIPQTTPTNVFPQPSTSLLFECEPPRTHLEYHQYLIDNTNHITFTDGTNQLHGYNVYECTQLLGYDNGLFMDKHLKQWICINN